MHLQVVEKLKVAISYVDNEKIACSIHIHCKSLLKEQWALKEAIVCCNHDINLCRFLLILKYKIFMTLMEVSNQ